MTYFQILPLSADDPIGRDRRRTRYSSIRDFDDALGALTGPDADIMAAARARQAQLTKPQGSLGRLETLAVFIAGWQLRELPFVAHGQAFVFAGDHGVTVPGTSAVTAVSTVESVANFAGGGAAINALARVADIELKVCAIDLDRPTADFTLDPAMSEEECLAALSIGAEAIEPGIDLVVLGAIGIGGSVAAAAICARSLGGTAADWVGPATGAVSPDHARTIALVDRALAFHVNAAQTAFETLRCVGGREIAAIAGAIVRARQLSIPVVLDGFSCGAALASMAAVQPDIVAHCIAGHCSAELGHARLLKRLGLEPLLRLDMHLGEGSGAALAVGIIRSALAAHADMATFAEAEMSAAV